MPRIKPFGYKSRKNLRALQNMSEKARWYRLYNGMQPPEIYWEVVDQLDDSGYNYLEIPSKKPKPKKCAIVEEMEKDTSEEDDQDEGQIHLIVKEETDIEQSPPKMTLTSKPRLRRVVKRRIVKDNTERHNIVERKIIKRSEYSKKDECDTFGEYISVSLRKHDERTRSMIKQAINNILFEQEMKKYNGGQHYTVVLSEMDDPNPLILGDECEK